MASLGNASGPVPPFAPGLLGPKGSLYGTRQTLLSHIAKRESTQAMADDLIDAATSGQVKIHIDQRYKLEDVQQAHRDLEACKTTGCTSLTLKDVPVTSATGCRACRPNLGWGRRWMRCAS